MAFRRACERLKQAESGIGLCRAQAEYLMIMCPAFDPCASVASTDHLDNMCAGSDGAGRVAHQRRLEKVRLVRSAAA